MVATTSLPPRARRASSSRMWRSSCLASCPPMINSDPRVFSISSRRFFPFGSCFFAMGDYLSIAVLQEARAETKLPVVNEAAALGEDGVTFQRVFAQQQHVGVGAFLQISFFFEREHARGVRCHKRQRLRQFEAALT